MPAKGGGRATGGAAGHKTTPADASRIQSTQAKSGADTGKGAFASRAQSAAAKNANASPSAAAKGGKGSKAVS
ncbi:hypothetical protein IEO21_07756 [Rhodonia placenta]|uniref:SMP domain-containing protein n=2 Tax=Rhodonia placenta TaxID=104341 RepID=A0A1X6N266_9APHY|nr:hypothetical protein POSPLADRAFT_1056077 [Postia placenta MAD-698-R-SB12]KAF9808784.1 hypothetical protein IEO21_07756 [Postia placenta]OSX62711.1 hypothetical protein POSPLADRAFT_1056077 [Postia placenta MAD-698-R-SB12]